MFALATAGWLFAGVCAAAVPAPSSLPSPAPAMASYARLSLDAGKAEQMPELSQTAARDMLLTLAYSLRDIRYRYGGHAPNTGFDCSGLVRYVFRNALGIVLPRQAHLQFSSGETVDRSHLEPGDLVFFRTQGRRITHVGIYLDDGRFIHAPRTGETIRVDRLNNPYWKQHYAGARRVGDLAQS